MNNNPQPEEKKELSAEDVLGKHITKLSSGQIMISAKQAITAMEEYKSLSHKEDTETVEFAEWMAQKTIETFEKSFTYIYFKDQKCYSIKELYKLFKDGK